MHLQIQFGVLRRACFLLMWLAPSGLLAQDTMSPMDLQMLSTRLIEDDGFKAIDTTGITFLAAGHWYGAHENSLSLYPSSSLYAHVAQLNDVHADWIFTLGDAVRDANDRRQVDAFGALRHQIEGNHLLVPGNHDLLTTGQYNAALGKLISDTLHNGDSYLFLNTESLRFGGGKAMLDDLKDGSIACRACNNVFVFSHRLLWALTEPGFQEMDDFANEPFAPMVDADTLEMVYAAVLKLASGRPLHWFSGDVGASWSEQVFYDHSADGLRHFYAAGLGDCKKDAFWQVHVDTLGVVTPRILLLDEVEKAGSLEEYDMAHWRVRMHERRAMGEKTFGERTWGVVKSRKFLLGLGAGLLVAVGLVFLWLLRRRTKL